jgi:hypothetical protein
VRLVVFRNLFGLDEILRLILCVVDVDTTVLIELDFFISQWELFYAVEKFQMWEKRDKKLGFFFSIGDYYNVSSGVRRFRHEKWGRYNGFNLMNQGIVLILVILSRFTFPQNCHQALNSI